MSTLPIEYVEPFGRAWNRMKDLLFRPFDLGRWLALGFTAWLATLTEGGGGGDGINSLRPLFENKEISAAIARFIHSHLTLVITILSCVLLGLFLLGLLLLWLSARGRFMFLENALTNQAAIAEPWRRWRRQGNSLFWWHLAFGFILLAVLLVLAGLCVGLAWPDIHGKHFGGYAVAAIVLGFLLLLPFGLSVGYITVFLGDFVVPLMRKHDLQTNAAWRCFLPLLRANAGAFLLYGLLRFAIGLVLGMALGCAGCLACLFTCGCVGCLLATPFIGTVVLLPVFAWKRYWGPEFLRQFGPEFDAWAGDPPAIPPAQALVTAPY
jgi:hypothetical protein